MTKTEYSQGYGLTMTSIQEKKDAALARELYVVLGVLGTAAALWLLVAQL